MSAAASETAQQVIKHGEREKRSRRRRRARRATSWDDDQLSAKGKYRGNSILASRNTHTAFPNSDSERSVSSNGDEKTSRRQETQVPSKELPTLRAGLAPL